MAKQNNRPDGRLVPIFAVEENLCSPEMVLALAKTAAARGETVLMLDQMGGRLMKQAGIIYHATLADVLEGDAKIHDAKYVSRNEHFTAACTGGADLEVLLGSLAALSLSYDWVFIGTSPGCTPAHTRLASAADAALLMYHGIGDKFMRAYWMLDAIRARCAKFDPVLISQNIADADDKHDNNAQESYDLLAHTVRQFLGAAPALGGVLESPSCANDIAPVLLEVLRQESSVAKRAVG